MKLHLAILAVLITSISFIRSGAGEDQFSANDSKEFFDKYKIMLADLERALSNFHAEAKLNEEKVDSFGNLPPASIDKYESSVSGFVKNNKFKFLKDTVLTIVHDSKPSFNGRKENPTNLPKEIFVGRAAIDNGESISTASKSKETKRYLLTNRKNAVATNVEAEIGQLNQLFRPQISLDHYYLPHLIKEQGFRLKSIERAAGGARGTHKLSFEHMEKNGVLIKGWWGVDANRSFVVTDFEYSENPQDTTFKVQRIVSGEPHYGSTPGDIRIVGYNNTNSHKMEILPNSTKKIDISRTLGQTASYSVRKKSLDVTLYSLASPPDAEFTLESLHLGDAELPVASPKRGVGALLGAVSVVILAAGILIIWFMRRRRNQ